MAVKKKAVTRKHQSKEPLINYTHRAVKKFVRLWIWTVEFLMWAV